MARIKSLASIKHKKIKKLAKGFHSARRRRIRAAIEAVLHAGRYAYHGRKLKKRDLRSIWIVRISAATKELGLSYSKFIDGLKKNKIEIDRKVLADLAVKNSNAFKAIVEKLKAK